MIGIETLLPQDINVATAFQEYAETFRLEVLDIQTESPFDDVIDWAKIESQTVSDANSLATNFGYENDQERSAVFRGILFARQTLAMLYSDCETLDLAKLWPSRRSMDTDEARESAQYRASSYLSAHLEVADFVGQYTHELDPNCLYGHRVEEVFAFVVMCGEVMLAEQYVVEELAGLTPDDFKK